MIGEQPSVGIVSIGTYFPRKKITAAEIAAASGFPEWVVREKFGLNEKFVRSPDEHPNWMCVQAVEDCLSKTAIEPEEIDVILCTTEDWKEYILWTAGVNLAHEIGAVNAWAIDVHMRCCTMVGAYKMARDMMIADPDVNTVLIAGGYGVGDFVSYEKQHNAFLYNVSAGASAVLLRKNWPRNHLLGSHLISDGSMSNHVLVPASGTKAHPTDEAVRNGLFSLDCVEPEAMKERLGEVTVRNWTTCIDEALHKSGRSKDEVGFLSMVLVKPSIHELLLEYLGLGPEQSFYCSDYGHIGEHDNNIAMMEGERLGRLTDGDLVMMVAAGTGYVWGATCIQWGPC